MEGSIFFGNTCHNGLVPPVARSALPSVHSALGIKHFLPFPLDNNTSPAVNLFHGFNALDPVQKAVLHHTLGLTPATAAVKKKPVPCGVCRLRFNSQNQALAHYKGTKHAKKLKALDAPKGKMKGTPLAKDTNAGSRKDSLPSTPPSPALRLALDNAVTTPAAPIDITGIMSVVPDAPETTSEADLNSPSEPEPEPDPDVEPEEDAEPETEEEKARRLLYCSLCKVAVNSASQLEAHNSGTKHKTMLEARSGVGSIKSFPRPGVKGKVAAPSSSNAATGLQNKTFYCETCDVHVNSETQLKQHISSRRHKDRAAGKPAKPKYTPYSKGAAKQTIKLSLGGDRPRPPLAANLLPAQLMAAAAVLGNTFPQRPAPNPALFPTPPLSASTLLRPAPGPVRTAHPQVLFAPY
ncbi:zinc finger protein 385D isoform X2 [Corythoichthys intestinalis]|uniref:zinc finger protein 385D isoform X2 n=1 Tax=Corythoichthys intestinalis TaxID=161448 RepID=UPI0025A4E5E8|nr:zinc finger protein 385D isoform X2 [Corythoichthys intestinalis]